VETLCRGENLVVAETLLMTHDALQRELRERYQRNIPINHARPVDTQGDVDQGLVDISAAHVEAGDNFDNGVSEATIGQILVEGPPLDEHSFMRDEGELWHAQDMHNDPIFEAAAAPTAAAVVPERESLPVDGEGPGAFNAPWDGFPHRPFANVVTPQLVEYLGETATPSDGTFPNGWHLPSITETTESDADIPVFTFDIEPINVKRHLVVPRRNARAYQRAVLDEVRERFGVMPKTEANVLAVRKLAGDIMRRHNLIPSQTQSFLPMIVAVAFVPDKYQAEANRVAKGFHMRKQEWLANLGRRPWPLEVGWWTVTKGIWR